MAGKAILLTTLLVVTIAHSMAIQDVLQIAGRLFEDDPTCGKPCNTRDDCFTGSFCSECWNFRKTCGPPVDPVLPRRRDQPEDIILEIESRLFQDDPTCGKPCDTRDDCFTGSFCSECWNFRKTCGPLVSHPGIARRRGDVAQIAARLFHADPTCGKPCDTRFDCDGGWFCSECWNFRKTCGPLVGPAMDM